MQNGIRQVQKTAQKRDNRKIKVNGMDYIKIHINNRCSVKKSDIGE